MSIFSRLMRKRTTEDPADTPGEKAREPERTEQERTLPEGFTESIPRILSAVSQAIEKFSDEDGKVNEINIRLDIRDMFVQKWFILVRNSKSDPLQSTLILAAEFPDDARYERPMVGYRATNYMFTGGKQEIIDYLTSQNGIEEITESIISLDKTVREHD